MRALVLIATLLWGGVSWWWYTCDIKGYCEADTVQVAANKKQESTATQQVDDKAEIEPAEVATVSSTETNSTAIDSGKQESPNAEKPVSDELKADVADSTGVTNDIASDAAKSGETTINTSDDIQEPVVTEGKVSSEDATTETPMADNVDTTPAENTTTDAEASTVDTADSSDTEQTDTITQEQSNTDETASTQTDTAEEIVSEDDNDPKKIRIDIVSGTSAANIKKARVYFPYSSSQKADLTGSATRYFDKVVEALKADSSLKVLLTGHTDSKGQAKRNQTLGLRRAETVKKIFIGKGISAKQIKTDSKGEDQPLSSNNSEAGRNKNRRVAVEVITE